MAGLLRGYFGGVVGVVVLIALGFGEGGIGRCGAAEGVHHVVGGDKGWDAASDVAAWSIDKVFRVGDNIWFAYSAAQEGIIELGSREEFESCDLRNPIKMYAGGLDRVSLDAAGARYFASGKPESCRNGLKLHVQVVAPRLEAGEQTAEVARLVINAEELASGPVPSGGSGHATGSALRHSIGLLVVVLCAVAF